MTHECQAFWDHFTMNAAKANYLTVSYSVWEGATLSQTNSLWSVQVHNTFCAVYLVTIVFSTATHTLTYGR